MEMSVYSRRLMRVLGLYGLSVVLLTLVRFGYLGWNWGAFAHQDGSRIARAFLSGARFDLAASVWLTLLPLLFTFLPWPAARETFWRRTVLALFLVLQAPFLIFNLIDIEFVNFVGRRMTADVLFLLGEAQGKAGGFLMTFRALFLFAAFCVALQLAGAWIVVARWNPRRPAWAPTGKAARAVASVLVFLLAVVASRGGLQSKPISFVDANVFAAPVLNNLVLNTSFNILKNLDQENLPREKFFDSRDEMLKHLNGGVKTPSLLEGKRPAKPQNVMILILESFGLEYTGGRAGGPTWTPFLDSLAARSLFFRNGFANGRRSIEGVAAVLSGIPALMNEPFVTSPFTANRFIGLGTLLQARNYETAFFHGGHNGTMHFDSFTKSAGVEKYFGASEYPDKNDDDGVWGIYDGPFLQWMADRVDELKPPFLATYFSITSHHPYLLPPTRAGQYKDGPLPIAKAITYADDALREFFEKIEDKPWFRDTLFVLVADHTFRAPSPEWDNELSRYRVPILFYHPAYDPTTPGHADWPAGIDRDQIVQQIDILPSVADFLGVPRAEEIALGRSVFVPGERTGVFFLDGNYLLVAKDYFLQKRRGEFPRMYALADAAQKEPLDEPAARKAELELRLKAAVQYFSEGMWDNRLYTPIAR